MSRITSSGGGENLPPWTEDKNSPKTVSGSDSVNYQIDTPKDIMMVTVAVTDADERANLRFRVNGDTGQNYRFWDITGSNQLSRTEISIGSVGSSGVDSAISFQFSGRFGGSMTYSQAGPIAQGDSAAAQAGQNDNVTSPITEFTIFEDVNPGSPDEMTVEVYGRNIA